MTVGTTILGRLAGAFVLALLATAGAAAKPGQPHVTIAVGGAGCLCYLPTMLAQALGAYDAAGVDVEIVDFKGGSQSLTAVLGGSADVVSGYYDHCIDIVPKGKSLEAFVTYDRYPGLVLAVSPKASIASVKDLAGRKVGVSAPGSSTDFFLKYLLRKNGVAPDSVPVVAVGLDATAVAAMERGMVEAAVMLDPAVTQLQARNKDLHILSDTRTRDDTLAVFGGEYPGGALYAQTPWIAAHPQEVQALADALVATLTWISQHDAEAIMAKMPKELVGENPALYLAALRSTMPMYSTTGRMDPKGAAAVLDVFGQSVPEIAAAHIDVAKTYTNAFVEAAAAKAGAGR